MDKVRFTIGATDVWQGFHDGDYGQAGALVWVTADTLRAVVGHFQSNWSTDFDRVNNAPTEDWETLAFGDEGTIVSPVDGITPIYRLTCAEALIVQRFNPEGGRTHERHFGAGNIELVPNGAWVNERAIDEDFDLGDGVAFDIVTHGFIINADDIARGMSDAPFIDTLQARRERDEQDKPEKVWVQSVKVLLSDGTEFEIEQDPHAHNNGTSFSPGLIPAAHDLEDAINAAINELNLYPEAAPGEV